MSNTSSSCTWYRGAYSRHTFCYLHNRKRDIHLHFWDNTSKDEKSEFGEHHEPYGLPGEAASTCQTLRWFNTSWNCVFRYSCFDPSATSVCPRTWHWQHSIDAPSMPHTLLWKGPASSILIKNPVSSSPILMEDFMPQQFLHPKEAASGSQSHG